MDTPAIAVHVRKNYARARWETLGKASVDEQEVDSAQAGGLRWGSVRQVDQSKEGKVMFRRTKELVAMAGLAIFAAYLALYFSRSYIDRVASNGEWMTARMFQSRAELIMSFPLLKIEGFFRSEKFFGYATDGKMPLMEAN